MGNHTPGPWMVLDTRYKGVECITIAPRHTPQALCRVRNDVTGMPLNDEDVANANLIAAAPELLAACIAALVNDEVQEAFGPSNRNMDDELREKLKAAIAKAKGE